MKAHTITKEQAEILMTAVFKMQMLDIEYFEYKEWGAEVWKNSRYSLWFRGPDIICYSDKENPVNVRRYDVV